MIKTQVQVPDHLYAEAKRIAREYEMSLAEVFRRGLERIATSYPPRSPQASKKWSPPSPRRLGTERISMDKLKEAAQMTSFEEELLQSGKPRRSK